MSQLALPVPNYFAATYTCSLPPGNGANLYFGEINTIYGTNLSSPNFGVISTNKNLDGSWSNSRIALVFDTSAIGQSAVISSAKLVLSGIALDNTDSVEIQIFGCTVSDTRIPFASVYNDALPYYVSLGTTLLGSLGLSNWPTTNTGDPSRDTQAREIILNNDGIAFINKQGLSKLFLKTNLDTNNVLPTGKNQLKLWENNNEQINAIAQVRLVVEYTLGGGGGLPQVLVSINPTPAIAGDTVLFTAFPFSGSGTYTDFYWEFGDGNFTHTQNPAHSYASTGLYNVTCVVTDSNNLTGYVLIPLQVNLSPFGSALGVSIKANPISPIVGNRIFFTAIAQGGFGPYTYRWEFNDGTISLSQTPTHSFGQEGTYSVTCQVTDSTLQTKTELLRLTVAPREVTAFPPSQIRNLLVLPSDRTLQLSWDSPSYVGSSGTSITKYHIKYGIHGGSLVDIITNDANTFYTLPNLDNTKSYDIAIAAINDVESEGAFLNVVANLLYNSVFVPAESYIRYNDNRIPSVSSFNSFINGITGIVRNYDEGQITPSVVYGQPSQTYPNFSNVPEYNIKSAKRKTGEVFVDGVYSYRTPPQITPTIPLSNPIYGFIDSMLGTMLGSLIPDKSIYKDIVNASATPGDVFNIYIDYAFQYPTVIDAFNNDYGERAKNVWLYNSITPGCTVVSQCSMPGWPYQYIITKPFMLFNTTQFTNIDSIIEVKLHLRKKPGTNVENRDIGVTSIDFSNSSLQTNILSASDYVDATIGLGYGSVNLNDPLFLTNELITIPINKYLLNPGNYTSIVAGTNRQSHGTIPEEWFSAIFTDVSLEVMFITGIHLKPSIPNNFTTIPGNAKVTCRWNPSTNDGGTAITGYECKNMNTGEVKTITPSPEMYAAFINLANGVLYTFECRAINSSGASFPARASITPGTQYSNTVPGSPQNVAAVPRDGTLTLSWSAPAYDGGSPITGYNLVNSTINTHVQLAANILTYTFTGLTNGVPYTLGVSAGNIVGSGNQVNVTSTPTASSLTLPSTPNILNVTPGNAQATVNWGFPSNTGGTVITKWQLVIHCTTNSDLLDQFYTLNNINVPNDTISFNFGNIINGNTYQVKVAAENSVGIGPFSVSHNFVPNPGLDGGGGSGGGDGTGRDYTNKVFLDWNYSKFFTYPVELNPVSENYLKPIYPQEVFTYSPARIESNTNYPVAIGAGNNTLYLNINTQDISFVIPGNTAYTIDSLVVVLNSLLNASNSPVFASNQANNLVLTHKEIGEDKNLSYAVSLTYSDAANNTIFGADPLFIVPTKIQEVSNNIPTKEYDQKNSKALVISRVWIPVRNKEVLKDKLLSLQEFGNDPVSLYAINTPNSNLKPTSISLSWFDNNQNLVTIKDYFGDGRLLLKKTFQVQPGDPIITTYERNDKFGYGAVNYETGKIYNLEFTNYHKGIVIGKGVKFPLNIVGNKFVYLYVNGVKISYHITADKNKTLESIVDDLRSETLNPLFLCNGLDAGVINNQLYIVNNSDIVCNNVLDTVSTFAPENTLTLSNDESDITSSLNLMLFGVNPTTLPSTRIYLSYAYTSNDLNRYKYNWYQTPHFTLRSKANPSQYITLAHYNYILDKLDSIRPANTVLEGLRVTPYFSEDLTASESFNISTVNATFPLIKIRPMPSFNSNLAGQILGVQVINPDQQTDTKPNLYTLT